MDDFNVLLLVVSANIVSLTKLALFLNHIDSLSMVHNIEPVTNVLTIAVNWKCLTVKSIVDD